MSTPMLVTEILPRTLADGDVSRPEGRAWLEGVYSPEPANRVRLNMITSLTGSAVGADGTSETLTGSVDRAILGIIRRAADVVLVGASTVRAEGYRAPRTAALAVVTTTGRLDGHRFGNEDDRLADDTRRTGRILLVCPADRESAVAAERDAQGIDAEVIAVPGSADLDPHAILGALRAHGFERVVCEGGPTLASRFVEAGAVDELCITVAPAVGPAPSPFLDVADGAPTSVHGMLVDEAGFSYLRLRPTGQPTPRPTR